MKRRLRTSRKHVLMNNSIKITWITDPHTYPPSEGTMQTDGNKLLYTGGAKMLNFVDETNRIKPELAICTGDLINHGTDNSTFLNAWNKIDASIRKEVCLGNHDLYDQTYEQAISSLGYENRPVNAGSVFNQSFSLTNGQFAIRVIICDATINDSGEHDGVLTGYMNQPTRDWIKNELLNCPEDIAIIFTHHGIAEYDYVTTDPYFSPNDAIAFKTIIDDVKQVRPNLKVSSLYGHHHYVLYVTKDDTFGNDIPSYLGVTLTNFEESKMVVIHVTKDGKLFFKHIRCRYPYPD